MKSLNKKRLRKEFSKIMISENFELPMFVCENIKKDFINVIRKYASFSEENFRFVIKILNERKCVFSLECLIDSMIITNNISQ